MTRRTPPLEAAAPPTTAQALQAVLAMANHAAAQIAAMENRAPRHTLFLLAFLLAPFTAAAHRRRVLELRAIAALLAALAEAFSLPGADATEAPPVATPIAAPAPPVSAHARRSAPRHPATAANQQRHPARARTPSHTLRPAARGSPRPQPRPLSALP